MASVAKCAKALRLNLVQEFGEALPGVQYLDRPGGYGFLLNSQRELAVVQTPAGLFLPGGGADPGERVEDAVRREIFEEIGYRVTAAQFLGQASQYHWSDFYQKYFRKIGSFFRVKAVAPPHPTLQADHLLLWMRRDEAAEALTQEFQRWAVANLASGS